MKTLLLIFALVSIVLILKTPQVHDSGVVVNTELSKQYCEYQNITGKTITLTSIGDLADTTKYKVHCYPN